jgi:hypothetical protein
MGKKKLEKIQSAAQQHKAKLYIIVACVALLLCGCGCTQQKKRRYQQHYSEHLLARKHEHGIRDLAGEVAAECIYVLRARTRTYAYWFVFGRLIQLET